MRLVYALVFVLFGVAIGSFTPALTAQADKPAAVAPKVPALDESDALAIQVVTLAGQLATSQCNELESAKNFRSLQTQAFARFEKKYPGYTVDMAKGALVAKAGK